MDDAQVLLPLPSHPADPQPYIIKQARSNKPALPFTNMASLQTTVNSLSSTAEIHHGSSPCKKRIHEVLQELCLPLGILPVDDVEELGYDGATGFFWIRQKKGKDHLFTKINQLVSYAAEVSGYVEKWKIRKLTGVKAREFLIWLTVTDVYIADPSSGKITFRTGTGLSDTFPISAFELEG